MAKMRNTQPDTKAGMADLAIQPYEVPYKKIVEDMGGGITRTTLVADKDDNE